MDAFNVTNDAGVNLVHASMDQTNQGFTMDCTNPSRISPPKSTIDSTPLQPAMDKNKESLKVKLLVRRSLNQLVEQGIMPSPKTSPAIYEQQRQLERAKTGDMLKAKIKQRPDRMELERRHILEHQEGNIDPSLAEKKRMLEKALLVDHLNSKISHRPGPLELIEKNILHAEEPIERIVKEGLVNYTSTDEAVSPAQTLRSPESMICIEDDSLSSEGETQNLQRVTPINVLLLTQPQSTTVSTDPPLIGTFSVGVGTAKVFETASSSDSTTFARPETSCVKKVGIEPVPFNVVECSKKSYPSSSVASSKSDLKEKSKKKNKNKVISKTRSIKFHEYKGPPNAQKHSSAAYNSGETNYQLIMKQQYLLEYLEEICKHPPATSGSSSMSFSVTAREKDTNSMAQGSETQKLPPDPATETLNKLKVFQLKRYCKKYNLPVSGSKSSLIERLKPFLHLMEQTSDFEGKNETDMSSNSNASIEAKPAEGIDEQVLKEQQKRIAELQMLLKKSQDELEHMKMIQLRSPPDFNAQTACSGSENFEQKREPETSQIFKSEEINITSLHTDKMLSDMDIKITVRIDADSPDPIIKPKLEPTFGGKDTLLSVIDSPSSILNTNGVKQWKTDTLLDAVVSEENMIQCDTVPHRTVSFPSNTETLDKLLGQVQPGIPNLNDTKEQGYKMNLEANAQSDMLSSKDVDPKSMGDEAMHTPLVLNDYNDVDLLDFHMQIDDTSDTFTIPKSIDSTFPNMDMKEPDCSSVNINKMNYESEMITGSNSSIYDRDDDKSNAFNDFDGLRFVHNGSYNELFKLHHAGMNVVPSTAVDPNLADSYLKMNHTNDINDNFTTIPANPALSCSFAQKHLDLSSSSEASSVKRCWMPNNAFYDANKLKIALENQQHCVQSNQNHSEIMNIAEMKNSDDRFSFDDQNKDTLLNSTCNNSTHTGHISPMDFDSLLSNINSPLTSQNCDRGVLDENQDKALYDLQQNNLLDYFTDDYGMHNAIL